VVVTTNDVGTAKRILSDLETYQQDYFDLGEFSRRIFATSHLGASNGENWKRHRKILNPGFYNLEKFFKPFINQSHRAVEKIWKTRELESGDSLNFKEIMREMTVDILGETIFEHDFKALESSSPELEAYNYLFNNIVNVSLLVPIQDILPNISQNFNSH
jgi:cytochrome P450